MRTFAAILRIGFCVWLGVGFCDTSAGQTVSPPLSAPAPYGDTCAVCHGGDAEGTDRAPPLVDSRPLRGRSTAEIASIITKGRGNMPAFGFLAPEQIGALASFVHSLNANAFDVKPAGDVAAGSAYYFGAGKCAECHTAEGRGNAGGPDLSHIAREATLAELRQALHQPGSRPVAGYDRVQVVMNDGTTQLGYARVLGEHALVLQTADGQLHSLLQNEYRSVIRLKDSVMPAFSGDATQERNLIAFLSTLNDVSVGSGPEQTAPTALSVRRVLQPELGDWASYSGGIDGNRHSRLSDIDAHNAADLRVAWIQSLPYSPLETTPVVMDGIMYVTAPNQVSALDGRTGSEIWTYTRPRTAAAGISGDAARGANRGVGLLGDRLFFITDNAHLICLQRTNGALLWEVAMPDQPGRYGGTSAPLVIGDLVIGGVSGGDEDIRGFIAAYKATTGERVWRTWTVPRAGEPGAETWKGDANPQGGASWTTPSYDAQSGTLYVSTGNPYPDTDGDARSGDNLYTDSDLALNAKTGKLIWHFQFTPHDLHDWDANQPIVLIDALFHGKQRKLLLHANRNGFFYVLDRVNGKFLQANALVKHLTWASGIDTNGRPVLLPNSTPTSAGVETCPAVRGATNWYSTAYDPQTHYYYVMTVEDCSNYRKAHDGGYGRVTHRDDPAAKVLRAIDVDSGKIAWEVPLRGNPEKNYSGVMSSDGGLVFYGESDGGLAAADALSGRILWHFETNQVLKGSPMTYRAGGRQFIAIAAGSNIISFALADKSL